MAENKEKNSEVTCVSKCEKDFVSCVDSWRQDCMDRYHSCTSACRI